MHFAGVLRAALQEVGIAVPATSPMQISALKRSAARAARAVDDIVTHRTHGLGPPHIRILEVLEALREIGTSYTTCQLHVALNIVPLVHAVCKYPHPDVARMANSTLQCWRKAATQHVLILTGMLPCSENR